MLVKLSFGLFLLFGGLLTSVQASMCRYWQAEVDSNTEVNYEVDRTKDENVLKGIDCLLKLQGKKGKGLFGGVTSDSVSQILPSPSIEVCALYYISYLFYDDWQHANGIALVGKGRGFNSTRAVSLAFASYRKWFERVKRIGLEKARKQKLDPLAGSGVKWY